MYSAVVASISSIQPIEGADKIVLATVANRQVIVSKDTQVGQKGIYFDTDGQLSEEFCRANDLIIRKDELGNRAGGMFNENRRVRAMKLRGVVSDGFWCPTNYLEFAGSGWQFMSEGFSFQTFNGVPICNKYVTQATQKAAKASQGPKVGKIPREVSERFKEHDSTEHFTRSINSIPINTLWTVTEKAHGTSHRFMKLQYSNPVLPSILWMLGRIPSFLPRIIRQGLSWAITSLNELRYSGPHRETVRVVHGTRRTIITDMDAPTGFYGSHDFRKRATESCNYDKLSIGETVYGEIVGYSGPHTPIMSHSTEVFNSKKITKEFGKKFDYHYGCQPGECKFFVYRITQTTDDGRVVELTWPQVVKRCKELNLTPVPQMGISFFFAEHTDMNIVLSELAKEVDGSLGGSDILTSTLAEHPREGIVIRVDGSETKFYKYKTRAFAIMEGYEKDNSDYVDMEESQGE